MCGRFTLRSDGNALAQHFELDAALASALPPPRFNIAPTQAIPVVRRNPDSGRREIILQRWGLVPHWAKDRKPLPVLFNARAETLAAKPAFREALRARRCLIPADGFYEWKALGNSKQPWFVHRPDDGLFAFAGLWEGETCTIITRAPTPALATLHDRMPAIPTPANYAAWLDPARGRAEDLLPLLDTPPDLALYPVRPLVNRAASDGPGCIAPASASEASPARPMLF
ncbi:MAG: SOS response-associated peptidase [Terriglobales bacterium]